MVQLLKSEMPGENTSTHDVLNCLILLITEGAMFRMGETMSSSLSAAQQRLYNFMIIDSNYFPLPFSGFTPNSLLAASH
jgi:hypothetical protein